MKKQHLSYYAIKIKKYKNRSKASGAKNRDTIKLFTLHINTTKIMLIVKILRNTIDAIFSGIRKCISEYSEHQASLVKREVEINDSQLGAR